MALKFFFAVLFVNHIIFSLADASVGFVYHDYDKLTRIMKNYAKKYPHKTYLYSIGKSVEGNIHFKTVLIKSIMG